MRWRTEPPKATRSEAASGTPRTSAGQNCRPYSRTLSATSWPTVRVSGGSGGGSGSLLRLTAAARTSRGRCSARVASASSRRQRVRSGSSISFEITPHLDGGHAGELGGPQNGEALHRLDVDAARPADARARADRAHVGVRERRAKPLEQRRIGQDARRHERAGGVAVDGLRAEDELERRQPARARDAHVQHGVGPQLRERAGGRGGGLDGTDAAGERCARHRPA